MSKQSLNFMLPEFRMLLTSNNMWFMNQVVH
jgi:hypothetical protein